MEKQGEVPDDRGPGPNNVSTMHEHLDGTFSITYGPHVVGRYDNRAVEMTPLRKTPNTGVSLNGLEKSDQKAA